MKMKKTVRMPLRRAPQRPRPPASSSLRARAATADEGYDDEEDYGGEEEPNMKLSHAFMVVLVLHVIAVIGVFAFNSIKAGQAAAAKATPPVPAKESTIAKEAVTTPAASAPATAAAAPAAALDGWKGKTHTVAANETLSRIATTYKTTIEAIEKENGITSYSVIRVGQVLKIPGTAPKAEAAKEAAAKQAFIATKTETAKPAEDVIPLTTSTKPAPVKAETAVVSSAPTPAPAAAAPVRNTPAAAPAAEDGVYVVAKGDNPYSIAKKLHVSYSDLIAVNEIKDPTKIQIGQKLKVPTKKN